MAGTKVSHRVTVTVIPVSEIAISGGDVSLTITRPPSDQALQAVTATDGGASQLKWTKTDAPGKISVKTDISSPRCELRVVARNVTGGAAAGEVTLTARDVDFVHINARAAGGCSLTYKATVKPETIPGTDIHAVTYTLTTQL
ncbi:MAG: hypothetical protein PHY31_01245 [Smithellaceae bacterium]|nr:hypothetical protein [Smithellaceae bacterium]